LDQQYYNAVCIDKDIFQEQIKELILYRQLEYQIALSKPKEELVGWA
jgi:hypothetical protein